MRPSSKGSLSMKRVTVVFILVFTLLLAQKVSAVENLNITVNDSTGTPSPGSRVERYTMAWQYLDAETADGNGIAHWNDVAPGDYNIEIYNGTSPDDSYWGAYIVSVVDGENTNETFQHVTPFVTDVKVMAGGTDVSGGYIDTGLTVNYEITVHNGLSSPQEVRVVLQMDRDTALPDDFTSTSTPVIVSGYTDAIISFTDTLDETGLYSYRCRVETNTSGDWTQTDFKDWTSGIITVIYLGGHECLFFDDFNYTSYTDPALFDAKWYIRDSAGTGPGSPNASWREDAVHFSVDPLDSENILMELVAKTTNSDSTSVNVEIYQDRKDFLYGTYSARIDFSETSITTEDLTVQSFFVFNHDAPYSEFDFEYVACDPENWWFGAGLYFSSFADYIYDGREYAEQPRKLSYQLGVLSGWHVLTVQVCDGKLKYYIDDTLVAVHNSAVCPVYPDTPMTLIFQHWFGGALGSSTEEREHHMQVDWVYYEADTALSPSQVETVVDTLRSNDVTHMDTIEPSPSVPDPNPYGDTDADGLYNKWEWDNGFDEQDPADGTQDADDDGYLNVYECLYETDSHNSTSFPAVTLYVDASSPAGGDGSIGSPYNTIQDALNAADYIEYEIIQVADGIYTGQGSCIANFMGKTAMLFSENGPAQCIFDGQDTRGGFLQGSINDTSAMIIRGFTIQNCRADQGAAVYFDAGTQARVQNCIITNNNANSHGGGIQVDNCSPLFENCVIASNSASVNGGGVSCAGASPVFRNCTIVDNQASYGGGVLSWTSTPVIVNCIFWNNTPDEISGQGVMVDYSDVEGGYTGTQNIDDNPEFSGTYHLKNTSPCIGAGLNNTDLFSYDIDSEARVYEGVVDIGADEFTDTDVDGMPDYWENPYGDLNPDDDLDDDGLVNLEEYENNTNSTNADTDNDVMPDGWEVDNDLNPVADDANEDADNDVFTNSDEYTARTDPQDDTSMPSSLSGVVIDVDTGETIDVVKVTYDSKEQDVCGETYSVNGVFNLTLLPIGVVEIDAQPEVATGYAWNSKEYVSLDSGENKANYILALEKGALASGYIKDSGGNPLSDMAYWCRGRNLDVNTVSGSNYQVRLPLGTFWVNLDQRPQYSGLAHRIVVTDISKPITIPDIIAYSDIDGGTILGTVSNPSSSPKAGEFMVVIFEEGADRDESDSLFYFNPISYDSLASAGPFSISSLPQGTSYDVALCVFEEDGLPSLAVRDYQSAVALGSSDVSLSYNSEGSTVTGRITDGTDGTIGTRVALINQTTPSLYGFTWTDEDGYYTVHNLAPGTYEVAAHHPRYVDDSIMDVIIEEGTPKQVPDVILSPLTKKIDRSSSFTITWDSSPGKTYDLYYSNGPFSDTMSWNLAQSNIPASTDNIRTSWTDDGTYTGTDPDTENERYYKITLSGSGPPVNPKDTVGFYRTTVVEGMNLVSLPFIPYTTNITGVLGLDQLTGADSPGMADRIWYWNRTIQDYEYTWLSTYPGFEGWRDPSTWQPTAISSEADMGFWVQIREGHGDKSICLMGKVSDTNRTLDMKRGMQQFGSTYPVSTGLNDADINATGADSPGMADRIWYWNRAIQDYEYTWLSTYPGFEGWRDPSTWQPTAISLEPGYGYWLQIRDENSDFIWTYPKP